MKKFFKRWDLPVVALIFASLICLFYKQVIFFDEMFIKRDIGRYYHPLRLLIRRIFESGSFPFWNPYLFCGLPLFATLQSCTLYPFSILYYFGDFSRMFNVFVLFHVFLAGFWMYVLMKELGLSRLASFFSAFTFAFSGYMISAINLTISLSGAAWFPLLLFAYKRAHDSVRARTRGWYLWSVLAAITLLLMLLAGDPAIVFISFCVLGCAAFYFFFEKLWETRAISLKGLAPFFLIVLIFGLISAFQIVPFLEFMRSTDRKAMPWWVAFSWSIPPTDLISLVIPFFNDINWYFGDYWQVQSWLDNYYLGIIALCFCAIGAFFNKTKRTNIFILFSVFALAVSLGKYSSFYAVLYSYFPLFKFIRYPVRFFFLVTFALAALAGTGLDHFRGCIGTDGRLRRFGRILLIAGFLSALALAILVIFSEKIFLKGWSHLAPIMKNPSPTKNIADLYSCLRMDYYNLKRVILLFSLFSFLFFLGTKKYVSARVLALLFVGMTLCDLTSTNLKYEATMDIKTYTEPSENVKFLQRDKTLFRVAVSPQIGRLHTRLPEKTYREGVLNAKDRLVTNRMIEFGISDISGYDSMYLSRNNRLLGVILGLKKPSDSRILDMLNVKYICINKTSGRKEGYRLVKRSKVAYLYQNLHALDRAYLAQRPVIITDEEKIIERLKDKAFDPEKEVILEEPVKGFSDPGTVSGGRERVTISRYTPNEVVIEATVTAPRFLILADTYYPGWKVTVDGKKAKIYRANFMLRAVYLSSPGAHVVRYRYDPLSFKVGVAISLIGLALAAGLVFYARKKKVQRDL